MERTRGRRAADHALGGGNMRIGGLMTVLAGATLWAAAARAQVADQPGFHDPQLFTRLPGYFLSEGSAFQEQQFGSHTFVTQQGNRRSEQRVEGHLLQYLYTFDPSRGAPASGLQIIRNYENAVRQLGGRVLYSVEDFPASHSSLQVTRNGKETWVEIEAYGNTYSLVIVEREAMSQDVVADATALQGGLTQSGHVAVPGIYFDTGRSELKPESEPALREVVRLLQANPAMRLWVVGHTDSQGTPESNVALSEARAAAVVRSLTGMGVAAARLAPHGAGPYAPVASNDTEEGRARNRRVELVKR
jgi:outer membrane protein OmpA-like peptidoglycan-associated protein